MNSVAPVWDGNETWLVLGGGGLLAAFPLAYALILPALYAPLIAMLLALIFRGVAFEFRWRTTRWRGVWDIAFIGGSTMAALAQGIALGGLLQGIEIDEAARLEALPQVVRDIAWKGQLRMCQRYRHLVAAGKAKVVVVTAVAREMLGFVWAIARAVTAPPVSPVATAV